MYFNKAFESQSELLTTTQTVYLTYDEIVLINAWAIKHLNEQYSNDQSKQQKTVCIHDFVARIYLFIYSP